MATNAELIADITAINEGAETEGLNNAQLSAKLKELKAAADEVKTFTVVKGKSITSKRGIIGPGEEVTGEDVADLEALRKRGLVE